MSICLCRLIGLVKSKDRQKFYSRVQVHLCGLLICTLFYISIVLAMVGVCSFQYVTRVSANQGLSIETPFRKTLGEFNRLSEYLICVYYCNCMTQ